MIHLEHSVIIRRPPAEVFAFIADPRNDSRWSAPIQATQITSTGPVGVGTTFRHDVTFLGRRFQTLAEIIEFVPNQKACVRTVGGPLQSTGCRLVEAIADGTRLVVTLEGEARGVFKLGEAMAARAAQRQLETDLARLAAFLEQHGPANAS